MVDLVVIIPTRGRPHTIKDLVESFNETCRTAVSVIFAVDEDDPELEAYSTAIRDALYLAGDENGWRTYLSRNQLVRGGVITTDAVNMVDALNKVARYVLDIERYEPVKAIAFMGDDHRPRTVGWDTAYLEALEDKPGLVYGNDLIQGRRLPTQVAISAPVVKALGHMAPDVLTHLYVDDYWRTLGEKAECLTYLPEVVVEHLHPSVGKAAWDPSYLRVNSKDMYDKDATAYGEYWTMNGARDVSRVRVAIGKEIDNGDQPV